MIAVSPGGRVVLFAAGCRFSTRLSRAYGRPRLLTALLLHRDLDSVMHEGEASLNNGLEAEVNRTLEQISAIEILLGAPIAMNVRTCSGVAPGSEYGDRQTSGCLTSVGRRSESAKIALTFNWRPALIESAGTGIDRRRTFRQCCREEK
jgi:hypothetical protein